MESTSDADRPPGTRRPGHPLISIILPTYNVESYLRECLDSIIGQQFASMEIIAVDGASKDASGAILQEYKKAEPRLEVYSQDQRIGPGLARNIGAHLATGEYLWFVDADDLISAGCLAAISRSLTMNSPDVLLVGYEEIGRRSGRRGDSSELFSQDVPACFTVADRPGVLDLTLAAWNKIIRRELFESADAQFMTEWPHEDICVSCVILFEAQKISVLPRVCYHYRKNLPGSTLRTGEARRHFNVFRAWDQVFECAQARAQSGDSLVTECVYQTLFERAIVHASWILDTGGFGIGSVGIGGYVRRRDRHEFFDSMRDLRRYSPAGYGPGRSLGARGLKIRMILGGRYWIYELLDPVNRLRVRLAGARRPRAKEDRPQDGASAVNCVRG